MESEEVKDIKEKLKEEIFIANSFGDKIRKVPTKELEKILALINEFESENERLTKDCAGIADDYQEMGGFYYEEAQKNQQLKDKVTELEGENKELRVVVDIANERAYRKKFTDEWRKEYQKELDKQGNGHIAGHPDFDLVYKLYFEQKDQIAELERENNELKVDIKNSIDMQKQMLDGFNNAIKEVEENLAREIPNLLKRFTERLIDKYGYDKLTHEPDEDIEIYLTASELDETLKEYEK